MMIGIVVSAGTKMVRRVVVPSGDSTEIDNHPLANGEQMLTIDGVDPATEFTPDVVNALAVTVLGFTPPSSRCCMIVMANAVNGHVANIIHADPAIDKVSGFRLVNHPTAQPGWNYNVATGLSAT